MTPPSASASLLLDATEGAGDATREGMGDGVTLRLGFSASFDSFPCSLRSRAAFDKLSRFPLPNLDQTWPGRLRCLFNWNIRHMSAW